MTPWTAARQTPSTMGFSRPEYWSGLPFPSPGIFPTQGSNPGLPHCRQTVLSSEPPGKPKKDTNKRFNTARRYNNHKVTHLRTRKYMKPKLTELREETDSSTIIIGDFNIAISRRKRAIGQKMYEEREDLTR